MGITYGILAILVCAVGGIGVFLYKVYNSGKATGEIESLKTGAKAREKQNESFDRNRGGLAERIGIRLRNRDDRET